MSLQEIGDYVSSQIPLIYYLQINVFLRKIEEWSSLIFSTVYISKLSLNMIAFDQRQGSSNYVLNTQLTVEEMD